MKQIHFNSKGPVWWHYPFWKPWGCLGCLGRLLLFLVLLFFFLLLLSQFRSCDRESQSRVPVDGGNGNDSVVEAPRDNALPPIDEDKIIEEDGREIVSNRLNVLFQAEVGEQDIERWKQKFHELYPGDEYRVLFCDINTKLMALEVPAERRQQMVTDLPTQIPDIPFIVFEEDVMDPSLRPDDPIAYDSEHNWYLKAVQAFDAWDITKGSDDVIIAVVDSYFDTIENPELKRANIETPYSVERGNGDVGLPESYDPGNPDPVMGHGTMVATLALGAMGNDHGTAGIAPECTFMPISLGSRFGCLAMLQGLLYAINHGAQVVNISAGMSFAPQVASMPVEAQIEMAKRELLAQERVWKYVFDMCEKYRVTIVWAAGNENLFTALDASKRGSNTIKVAATDRNGAKAEFSNFGNFASRNIYEATVSAPGCQIYGELPGETESTFVDGTSFSAPIVAGAVGLMKSLDITLSTQEISDILRSTGRPVRGNSTVGPIIQIRAALDKVIEGFLPFDTFKHVLGNVPGDSVRYATTLMRPLSIADDEDSTVLPPLIQLSFVFKNNGRGRVYYTSNLAPDDPWTANITYNFSGDKVLIEQSEIAHRASEPEAPGFQQAKFTVVADNRGKCIIERIESESIPAEYTPYIKI